MKLYLKTYNPSIIAKTIGKVLKCNTKTEMVKEELFLPKKYGEGRILGYNFSDGVDLILMDCTFKQKMTIIFDKTLLSPLLFNFVSTGSFTHTSNYENNYYTLNPLQSTITANQMGSPEAFIFPALEKIVFSCIIVDRQNFKPKVEVGVDEIPEKVQSIFLDTQTQKPFFYQTNYSMASSIHLQSVLNNEHIDLARSVYLEGITLELLSNQIKQFKKSISPTTAKKTVLNDEDIEKILDAKEILLRNLQESPTIESLSIEVGVNQTKLKTGFRSIFDLPIKTWLRYKRLENAQLLLLQDQQSIKQISESVGYSNQSHFAKQFKTRYGVLPKDYLKQIKKARTFDL